MHNAYLEEVGVEKREGKCKEEFYMLQLPKTSKQASKPLYLHIVSSKTMNEKGYLTAGERKAKARELIFVGCRVRTCAGEPNRFQVCRLNHSAKPT